MQVEKQASFAEDIQDTIVTRLERLLRGATVAEATADLVDEHSRCVVCGVLFSLYVDALITGLESLHILNRKQVEELQAFLHVGPGSMPSSA